LEKGLLMSLALLLEEPSMYDSIPSTPHAGSLSAHTVVAR